MYDFLLKNINTFIRYYYYDYYFKNKNEIKNMKNISFKLEYFLYLRFYFMYLFFHYLKKRNTIYYSFLLNFQHVIGDVCMTNYKHYKIQSEFNIEFLNKTTMYIFDYLLINKIYFNKNMNFITKFIVISGILLFQLGIITQRLFLKRINSIKNKTHQDDNFDFIFLLPGFENIVKVIEKTKFMNYQNFYVFLNTLLTLFYS